MNTYADATGVIFFDGEPRISPSLKAWLAPLLSGELKIVPADETDIGIAGVAVYSEGESEFRLDDFEEPMRAALRACGIAESSVEELDGDGLFIELAKHYGVSDHLSMVLQEVQSGDLDGISISTAVEMAMAFCIGHNIKGVLSDTGIHSDRMTLWGFSGYAELTTRCSDGRVRTGTVAPRWLLQGLLGNPGGTGAQIEQRLAETLAELMPTDEAAVLLTRAAERVRSMADAAAAVPANQFAVERPRGG
jgi:hypothetical protein